MGVNQELKTLNLDILFSFYRAKMLLGNKNET